MSDAADDRGDRRGAGPHAGAAAAQADLQAGRRHLHQAGRQRHRVLRVSAELAFFTAQHFCLRAYVITFRERAYPCFGKF